jgi:hypothetical protein
LIRIGFSESTLSLTNKSWCLFSSIRVHNSQFLFCKTLERCHYLITFQLTILPTGIFLDSTKTNAFIIKLAICRASLSKANLVFDETILLCYKKQEKGKEKTKIKLARDIYYQIRNYIVLLNETAYLNYNLSYIPYYFWASPSPIVFSSGLPLYCSSVLPMQRETGECCFPNQ